MKKREHKLYSLTNLIEDINSLLLNRNLKGDEKLRSYMSNHIATAREWAEHYMIHNSGGEYCGKSIQESFN